MLQSTYFVLFFVSGIAGLIYESIWSHYLKLFLGHAAYSQTLVLVIYMGGMAVGAWLGGSQIKRIHNLLKIYGLIECILGLFAIIFHSFFIRYLDISYQTIIPSLENSFLIIGYKWLTSAIIILPQSILLGATFPFMASGFIRKFPGASGFKISFLYFANTFGASLGVLLSGFVLIEKVGLKGTIITGGILDIIVGAAVLFLSRQNSALRKDELPIFEEKCIQRHTQADRPSYYLPLMLISGITAASSFMYEIGWIRMLSLVLGSSTHSFELMLSAFILGMALGSFFIRKRIDQIVNIPRAIVLAQVVMGLTAFLTIFTYSHMFGFMQFIIEALSKSSQGYFLFNLFCDLICLLIMLPSTICAGMVLPLIISLFYRDGYGEEYVGKIYSINTFGGIVGVIIAVWAIMPNCGVGLLITLGGLIDIVIGLYILMKFKENQESDLKRILPVLCALLFCITFVFGKIDPILAASGVYRNGKINKNKKVIFNKDGKTATITLSRSGEYLSLATNGKPDASVNTKSGFSDDEYTMALTGVLPMSIAGSISTAAVIGMGSGMTAHYLLYDSTIKSVDIVEIEKEMVNAAKKIGNKVSNTFKDPRSHIYIDDAKTFFSSHNRSYDVIVSEPSNPWVSGVSGLFSKEFFGLIKSHLNADGILVQWFHKYESDQSIMISVLKALQIHFPNYAMYAAGSDLVIIAAVSHSTDLSLKKDVFQIPALAQNLNAMNFRSIEDFKAIQFATHKLFTPLLQCYDYPPNSDYYPFIDLNAVKYRFLKGDIGIIDTLRDYIIPFRKVLENDTGFIAYKERDSLPPLYNFEQFKNAKKLYKEFVRSESASTADRSEEFIALDYASMTHEILSFDQIFLSTTKVLEKTIPYLSISEMRDIYRIIEKKVSPAVKTDDDRLWMNYFEALCNYDMPALQNKASVLLSGTDTIENNCVGRFLMASMNLAAFVNKDTSGVSEYWEKFKENRMTDVLGRVSRTLLYK